ncbi:MULTISPECIES: TetR/AcrR family transcriptional regulator [Nonomuraea]|uniref:TetR/AcrR family transcriptional regulator n=1 Tax=Nonomuraea mangrovi TaxID=2316207 RepID=A0ABW4TFG6_9ACTN
MKSQRAELVADTAITVLAERGVHGLTHRTVDETAGLAPGSASNVARTRLALLELVLERLAELDTVAFGFGAEPVVPEGTATAAVLDMFAAMTARTLHVRLTSERRQSIARYELAMEATRHPGLRELYDAVGRRLRDPVVAMFTALGSPDPARHGQQAVAFLEGVMFDALVGAGPEPAEEGIRLGVRELFRGMLGQ